MGITESESPILIYRLPSFQDVIRWTRLGHHCEIEVLDTFETVKCYDVKWKKRNECVIYDGSDIININLQKFISNNRCRIIVFQRKNTLKSILSHIFGYFFAKLFQLVPQNINASHSIPYFSLISDGGRFLFKKKYFCLSHDTGLIALHFSPNLLRRASEGITTILVTGTNGKSTVTKMIHEGLMAMGIGSVYNETGYNMLGGIATPLIWNMRLGKSSAKWAVLECDEGWLMDITRVLKPAVIIVTNISQDSDLQSIRFKSPEITKSYIERAIRESSPMYIICGEDIHLDIADVHSKMVRYRISDDMKCSIPGQYNLKNVAAACACLKLFGLDSLVARNAIYNATPPFGRGETFDVHGKKVTLILTKNISSITLSLDYLGSLHEKTNIIMCINEGVDMEGNRCYSGWLTDGFVSERIKRIECNLFLAGTLSDILYEHFHSEGIGPITRLTSISSIIPTISNLEGRIYLLFGWPVEDIMHLMKPFNRVQSS